MLTALKHNKKSLLVQIYNSAQTWIKSKYVPISIGIYERNDGVEVLYISVPKGTNVKIIES